MLGVNEYRRLVDADTFSGLKSQLYGIISILHDSDFVNKENAIDKLISVITDMTECEMGCLTDIKKEKLPQK